MTRKLAIHRIPRSVAAREIEFNRDNLLTAFDKVFDDAFKTSFPEIYDVFGFGPFGKSAYPKVNVISFDNRIEIEAEIAGFVKEDIDIQVEEDVLTIMGKSSTSNEFADETPAPVYILRELKRSSFSRSFRLGDELDREDVEATFRDGILRISIPRRTKREEPRVNKVTIS
jgi:HSP20 family protein